jgi:hypothetical protein
LPSPFPPKIVRTLFEVKVISAAGASETLASQFSCLAQPPLVGVPVNLSELTLPLLWKWIAIPQKYAATFFSYIDPDTMKMDDGFTEHSGCPVVEGEKKIVTQWVRLGVDYENPWNSFNTLGIKYSDADNQ